MRRIGIARGAGVRAEHLLEQQHIAGLARSDTGRPASPASRRAAGSSACRSRCRTTDCCVHWCRRRDRAAARTPSGDSSMASSSFLRERARCRDRNRGQRVEELRGPVRDSVTVAHGNLELQPGTRVAAVVHRVVDQQRMAPQRDAAPRRVQIRLGRDRVLLVAELVADVGQQLDQRDAVVRDAALLPAWRQAAPCGRASGDGTSA